MGLPGDVKLDVRDVRVGINLGDPATKTVLDLSKSRLDVVTGTGSARRLSLDGSSGESLSVAAGVHIDLGGFVYLDGTAAF